LSKRQKTTKQVVVFGPPIKKRLGEMGLSEMKLGEMRLGEMRLPTYDKQHVYAYLQLFSR